MDIPFTSLIAYFIIWGTWLLTHETLSMNNEIDYAIKLDNILYNNVSTTEFPFGMRDFEEFNMV